MDEEKTLFKVIIRQLLAERALGRLRHCIFQTERFGFESS